MKSMSFTVFSYNATVLLIQPITCAGKCDPTQPVVGPNPCPSLRWLLGGAGVSAGDHRGRCGVRSRRLHRRHRRRQRRHATQVRV